MNNQYLDVFLEEAREHIDSLNECLLNLENNPAQEIVDEIFRSAHTLKGMSGTMGHVQLSELTHEMENLLQEIRDHKIDVNAEIIDTLLKCVDILEELIGDIAEHGKEKQRDIQTVINKLKKKNIYNKTEQKIILDNKTINLNEYEDRIIRQALEEGLYIWKIVIKLVEDCLLKSARAFLIFKTLETLGEIIKTEPIVQDIEDEKFDNEFTLYLVTSYNKDKVLESLETVSELGSIDIDKVDEELLGISKGISHELHMDNQLSKPMANQQTVTKRITNFKKTSKTLRVDIERLDVLMNLVSELIIIKTRLEDIDESNSNQNRQRETVEYLERITSNLHDAVMKVRMVPIETVFNRFPRVVHDLSRELSKKIDLIIEGAETELDRTIIDEIGDPLIHLIRNAADHGIETPQERIGKGKPEHGTIKLNAYHDGNNVVIEVSDDGKGINLSSVLKKSIEHGLVEKDQSNNLKEYEITSFLFEPGFSTKSNVSDVSGRGVGLDVVKTKIESLGGSIEIKNKQDVGTTFLIRLPLTLAIIQALMVMVGEEKYAIPLSAIKETVIISVGEIKKVQKSEVTVLRGNVVPIVRLNRVLDIKRQKNDPLNLTLVIVRKGEKDVGLVVDDLIGQQEIVIKTLGSLLKNIKFIAGATILGDGQVALILDINNLI
ncbi:MAG: chemotaxis protein CheA [Tepidanaerobacteraceae bacterium]|nr:chemotaxis protein CheA [Tepidanaerobacteraceae bacterium]